MAKILYWKLQHSASSSNPLLSLGFNCQLFYEKGAFNIWPGVAVLHALVCCTSPTTVSEYHHQSVHLVLIRGSLHRLRDL